MTFPATARGFLIDLDGTLLEAQNLVPGAAQALAFLKDREVPYRLVTNTTSKPHSAIMEKIRSHGLDIPPDAVITAPLIGREYLIQRGLTRCYPLVRDSLREDLHGIEFVEESPQAVLLGDLGEELSYASTQSRVFVSCLIVKLPSSRSLEIAIFEAATDFAWTSAPRLPHWSTRLPERPFSSESLRRNFFSALVKAWVWLPKTRSLSGTIWRPTLVEQSLRVVRASWCVPESSALTSWKTRLFAPTECSTPWATFPISFVKKSQLRFSARLARNGDVTIICETVH